MLSKRALSKPSSKHKTQKSACFQAVHVRLALDFLCEIFIVWGKKFAADFFRGYKILVCCLCAFMLCNIRSN